MPPSKRSEKEVNWAIKKQDSEPFFRWDIQWAVLDAIFQDRTFQFTAPVDQNAPPTEPIYLNFDQLYLEAILSSTKTTQHLRQKLIEDAQFALNFCKLCLLINVGRLNTTLAFYATMKTALRTYHPIPSLQNNENSRKELTDSPRIKTLLKACFLDWEVTDQPTCLRDIAKRAAATDPPTKRAGPPTTVVTAIFHLFNEVNWASERYFPPGTDLWDVFYPSNMPSRPRAEAFLTILHRILEQPAFAHDFDPDVQLPIQLTPPVNLLPAAPNAPPENVDSPDELAYAKEMKSERADVVKTVPAIMQREAELKAREKRTIDKAIEREEILLAGGTSGGGTAAGGVVGGSLLSTPLLKKRRLVRLSHAKQMNGKKSPFDVLEILPPEWEEEDWEADRSNESCLPGAWRHVKHAMDTRRDPDYDSDEEYMPWTVLERRKLITFTDPARGGQRVKPSEMPEYQEWLKLKNAADGQQQDYDYPGDSLETANVKDQEDDD